MIERAPIRFHPYYKTVIWGGSRICRYKGIPQAVPKIGESWEISAIPGHESVVSEGPYEGMNIIELIERFGIGLLGESVNRRYGGKFPLLIKFIDANDRLSVQVHPDDGLAAQRHGCMGKSELWYIIDAEEGSKIFSGLTRSITPEEYIKLVEEESFQSVLAVHDSAPGDVFFLPAGRVHSIGPGNLLAEIQQSSDITYRIYDYGRKDSDGNPRQLHTELAKDAIDYKAYGEYKMHEVSEDDPHRELVRCGHFVTSRLNLDGRRDFRFDGSSFNILIGIKGSATVEYPGGTCEIAAGQSLLLPAALEAISLSGRATLLLTHS